MNITIYNQTSGEIRQWGDVPEEFVEQQLQPGDSFIEGIYPADQYYWGGSGMVEKPVRLESSSWDSASKRWFVDPEAAWAAVRAKRNGLLKACDWRLMPDSPSTPEEKAAWATYRQALRDITSQPDPLNIVWPDPPA